MDNSISNEVILTGDRPTGPLHIGHYVGSLKKRLELQYQYAKPYVMIADVQALTDHAGNPQQVRDNVLEVACDYLAIGLKPELNTFFIQSLVPELAEMTVYYLNYVTLARLKRNPTVKEESHQKGYKETVPVGFLAYPVSQAADITAFHATLIPVGEDQLPMIEQTNEIVRRINNQFQTNVLTECKPLLSKIARLSGLDGKAKMGKSLVNALYLSDTPETIHKKVMGMFTDPKHLHKNDPGNVENNAVFKYLEAFSTDLEKLEEMKSHYRRGGLGDVETKQYLEAILQKEMKPIREKRVELQAQEDWIMQMLKQGSENARSVAARTLLELKFFLKLKY
jgi:tryptophanyl-tRNA synthetase